MRFRDAEPYPGAAVGPPMHTLMRHFAAGAVAGAFFLAAVLLLDIGGIGTLLLHDRAVFVPFFMLLVDLCGLFGMVVMLSSAWDEERPSGLGAPSRGSGLRVAPPPRSPNT